MNLHEAASFAYRFGKPEVAAALIEIAEAAGRVNAGAAPAVGAAASAGIGTVHSAEAASVTQLIDAIGGHRGLFAENAS